MESNLLIIVMILKPTPEMPKQAHRSEKAVRFLIDSQASSPIGPLAK